MTPLQFDEATADLVAYMEWMAEPAAGTRKKLGVWVLFLMSFFVLFTWLLSKTYWKQVK
jgi:ubiquinol-cytochrome c reductase cytochrome c1 subunit